MTGDSAIRPVIPAAALFLFAFLVILAVPSSADVPDTPIRDVGMEDQLMLLPRIEADFDAMESGSTIPLRVIVLDQHYLPVEGVEVQVVADGLVATPSTGLTDSDGVFRFTVTGRVRELTDAVVAVGAAKGTAVMGDARMLITVTPRVDRPIAIPRQEAASLGLLSVILAVVGSTEFGRYGLFKVLVFPLYSRLKKEEVLDHFVRGQLYGHIASHPGEHYNALRENLRVTNGTLSHHLRTLEMQGFIKSRRDGIYRRFYPIDMTIPQENGLRLSDLQILMLERVRRREAGASQSELARELDVSQQTVSYNLRTLSRHGMVRTEKVGRYTRYHIADG